jgi:hypothetical protein
MTESDLRRRLSAEGLSAGAWSKGPGDRYAAHEHGYDKALVVAAGSIGFGLHVEDRLVELAVGDRLDLPAGTAHDAVVGPAGARSRGARPGRPARRIVVTLTVPDMKRGPDGYRGPVG